MYIASFRKPFEFVVVSGGLGLGLTFQGNVFRILIDRQTLKGDRRQLSAMLSGRPPVLSHTHTYT